MRGFRLYSKQEPNDPTPPLRSRPQSQRDEPTSLDKEGETAMQMLFEFTLARAHLCHEVHRAAARFYLESEDRMEERLRCALAHIGEVGTSESQIQQVNRLIRDLTQHLQSEMQIWIDSTLQAVLNEGLRTIALAVQRQTDHLACVEQDESEAGLSEHQVE